MNLQINKKLRYGYDVGKGYAMGEEEVLQFLESMIENRVVAKQLKHSITEARLTVIKELGEQLKANTTKHGLMQCCYCNVVWQL